MDRDKPIDAGNAGVSGFVMPPSVTRALCQSRDIRTLEDLTEVQQAIFRDFGNEALSLIETQTIGQVVLTSLRLRLAQLRFGVLGTLQVNSSRLREILGLEKQSLAMPPAVPPVVVPVVESPALVTPRKIRSSGRRRKTSAPLTLVSLKKVKKA